MLKKSYILLLKMCFGFTFFYFLLLAQNTFVIGIVCQWVSNVIFSIIDCCDFVHPEYIKHHIFLQWQAYPCPPLSSATVLFRSLSETTNGNIGKDSLPRHWSQSHSNTASQFQVKSTPGLSVQTCLFLTSSFSGH